MIRIELLRDYRGIKINDELWLKGIYEVADDLGAYLIGKSYARASIASLPANTAGSDAKTDPTLYSNPNFSRDELLEMTEKRGIKVEGTGTAGYITMQDLRDALDNRD